MKDDRLLFSMKYLLILLIQINTVTYRIIINSILTSVSGTLQEWFGILQNSTKILNMTNPKLKNNPAEFPHTLRNILKSNKKLDYIWKSEIL